MLPAGARIEGPVGPRNSSTIYRDLPLFHTCRVDYEKREHQQFGDEHIYHLTG